jgi:hypothetical protein
MWWFKMIGVRVRSVGEGAKALSANAGRRVNFTHDLRMSLRARNYRIYSARHK